MSEAEIKKRQEYKRNRKKWLIIQVIAIALVAIIAIGSFVTYYQLNKTYYIEYTEQGSVDYRVQLKDNSFFEEEWSESGNAYISNLIKNIEADFKYVLDMDAGRVGFDYAYSITAQVIVADKDSGAHLYDPTFEILPQKNAVASGGGLVIKEKVDVDYNKYNAIANDFINAYELKNASSTLVVTLNVDVLSQCDEFKENNANSYAVSLHVPLIDRTFSIETSTGVPESESKVLACTDSISQTVFLVIGIVSGVAVLILLCVLAVFMYLTKNEDITYANKVRRLVSSYRSFIQQMEGEFDDEGYQVIVIKTFVEMLGIRDTIQSPILMYENRDETMTRFLIPTNTKILYTYEIKVDNYDAIYGGQEVNEPKIIEEDVDAEALEIALAAPDVVLEEIDYEADNDVDYEGTEQAPGIEVVGVVWPERAKNNKVYRYDPNGEQLAEGDVVLVPTRDAAKDREVIRKAAIAHANHTIDPALHPHTIKKIIGVIKRRAEAALTPENTKNNTDK